MRISILLVGLLTACSTPKAINNASTDQIGFEEVAEKQLGASAHCLKNESETLVLCISETDNHSQEPRQTISFMVIKLEDASVLYESSIDGGSVKWFDDEQLEIFTTPGYMRQDQTNDDYTKIYNLTSGQSMSKTEYLDKKK